MGRGKDILLEKAAASNVFDRHYVVEEIAAYGGENVLMLKNVEVLGSTLVGEEQQGFI